jgi:hypothetical protein
METIWLINRSQNDGLFSDFTFIGQTNITLQWRSSVRLRSAFKIPLRQDMAGRNTLVLVETALDKVLELYNCCSFWTVGIGAWPRGRGISFITSCHVPRRLLLLATM